MNSQECLQVAILHSLSEQRRFDGIIAVNEILNVLIVLFVEFSRPVESPARLFAFHNFICMNRKNFYRPLSISKSRNSTCRHFIFGLRCLLCESDRFAKKKEAEIATLFHQICLRRRLYSDNKNETSFAEFRIDFLGCRNGFSIHNYLQSALSMSSQSFHPTSAYYKYLR